MNNTTEAEEFVSAILKDNNILAAKKLDSILLKKCAKKIDEVLSLQL